jgi:hypothetical protein
VDPATFINDVEKRPIPTTVRKEVNAQVFQPLIEGSGRNSLDTEAYLGGFA